MGGGYDGEGEQALPASFCLSQGTSVWSLILCNSFFSLFFLLTSFNLRSYFCLLLFICRNPHGQSVGYHRAGVDHLPRERGELASLCLGVVLFYFSSSSICSICLLIEPNLPWTAEPPAVLCLCFFCICMECLLSWIVKKLAATLWEINVGF